ncbi:hypothetical protein ACP70R_036771 [Stipagrostis hirtigluma subsp. patula]
MAARVGIALCLILVIAGVALAASPAEARAMAGGYAAAPPPGIDVVATGGSGIRRGRWNVRRGLQGGDAAHKREVPGGPDPQHHS